MKPRTRPLAKNSRCLLVFASLALATSSHAIDITWDAGGSDDNWSNPDNWSDLDGPSGDDITFDNTGGAAGTTVTSIVDTNLSVDSLNFRQDNTLNHTLSILENQTLTVNGSFTPSGGQGTAVLFGQPIINDIASTTHITGLGTFTVNSPANHFLVGYANTTAAFPATVDMSGLSNFNATVNVFGVGRKGTTSADIPGRNQPGVLTLAKNNTITATAISVGSQASINGTTTNGNGNGGSVLNLGSGGNAVNNLNADRITVALGKGGSNNILQFASGAVASDTVTIRAKDTSSAVGIFDIGTRNIDGTAGAPVGTVDFGVGKVDAKISNLTVGWWASGVGSAQVPGVTGTFTTGTNALSQVTVETLNLALSTSSTAIGGTVTRVLTGNLNVTGGVFSATTVNMSTGNATTRLNKTSNLTVDGGTFRFGTFGAPTGTNTVNINFSSGAVSSIDDTDRTLGLAYKLGKAGGSTLTFGQTSGGTGTIALDGAGALQGDTIVETLVDATIGTGGLSGAFGVTKTGASTLTNSGTNTYTGTTAVDAGKLLINGTHITPTAGSGYTVTNAGSTLGGTGRLAVNGNVSVGSAAYLAPGASIGTLTLDGANTTGTVLSMTTDSKFAFELDASGGTPDRLDFWNYLGGDLGLNDNAIDLSLLGTQTAGTYNVDLFRFFSDGVGSATTHAFANGLTLGTLGTGISSAVIDWNGTGDNNQTIALTYTVVPEPRAALLGGLGVLALLRRRRCT